jgi:hypothetical protein
VEYYSVTNMNTDTHLFFFLRERSLSGITTYGMSSFMWNNQSRQIHRDRKQIGSFRGRRLGVRWGVTALDYGASFGVIKVSKTNGGTNYTTL